MEINPVLIGLGLLVGVLVGLTGVGGGSLLTPLLILVAGTRPTVAVGTDLAFAALTKMVGGWQHTRRGTADLRLTYWLACGSVPGAIIGSVLVSLMDSVSAAGADPLVQRLLGITLLLAAFASLVRAAGFHRAPLGEAPTRVGAAVLGLVVGLLVGITSIGAGSVLMAVLALLYTLPPTRAVGTDVVHGAILAVVAAAAHALGGRLELPLLGSLLIGSVPGVLVGTWLCDRVPARPLRFAIAAILAFAGFRLL
jgi:uncharacterized membrane protein YfcA